MAEKFLSSCYFRDFKAFLRSASEDIMRPTAWAAFTDWLMEETDANPFLYELTGAMKSAADDCLSIKEPSNRKLDSLFRKGLLTPYQANSFTGVLVQENSIEQPKVRLYAAYIVNTIINCAILQEGSRQMGEPMSVYRQLAWMFFRIGVGDVDDYNVCNEEIDFAMQIDWPRPNYDQRFEFSNAVAAFKRYINNHLAITRPRTMSREYSEYIHRRKDAFTYTVINRLMAIRLRLLSLTFPVIFAQAEAEEREKRTRDEAQRHSDAYFELVRLGFHDRMMRLPGDRPQDRVNLFVDQWIMHSGFGTPEYTQERGRETAESILSWEEFQNPYTGLTSQRM